MFQPRIVAASLSGESDAEWAKAARPFVGGAILGGIALDEQSRTAARTMVRDRDRTEFLPPDPHGFIERELGALADVPITTGFNVRSTTREPIIHAGEICSRYDSILEINAHCRQPELCTVGCGESLLKATDRLCSFVGAAAETGVTVSVKVRAEVDGVDLIDTARRVVAAGARILHVDAMDSESVIRDLTTAPVDAFVIANNGVRGPTSVAEYFAFGADAVSVGRPSTNPRVLSRVHDATERWWNHREVQA